MQNEEQPEQPPVEEPAPPPAEPEGEQPLAKKQKEAGTFDAANCETVAPDSICSNCNWEWGMIEPHPVHVTPQNLAVPVEAVPESPPAFKPPAPDPNACAPVAPGTTCPKCAWNSNDPDPAVAYKPHPIF